MGDHGRYIPIDKQAYLEVFVRPQNYESLRETIDEEIEWRSKHHNEKNERAEVVTRAQARLGGASATRLKLRYQDAKTGEFMVEDIIIGRKVDRHHGGWLYLITLATPEKLYATRNPLLYSIVRSWKYRPVP